MFLFILCFLGVFALLAMIFGRDTAQRGLFLTLGVSGALILYFVQALLWVGLVALAFLLPPLGIPLLALALILRYAVPFGRVLAKSRREGAVLSVENEERRRRLYLAERRVEQLQQALERTDDDATVSLCKELNQDEGWHLALPALQDALASPRAEMRLGAAHGLRHIYSAQAVQRFPECDVTFDAVTRQHSHNCAYKPELVWEVTEMLARRALNSQEETRVRVAALIGIGNAAFEEAYGTVLVLLRDKNDDVRAAACRAARQLMYPAPPIPSTRWRDDVPPTPEDWGRQTAGALYQSYFNDMLDALGTRSERLVLEAVATACTMAQLVALSAADLDGLIRVVLKLSTDSSVGVKVHDAEVLHDAEDGLRDLRGGGPTRFVAVRADHGAAAAEPHGPFGAPPVRAGHADATESEGVRGHGVHLALDDQHEVTRHALGCREQATRPALQRQGLRLAAGHVADHVDQGAVLVTDREREAPAVPPHAETVQGGRGPAPHRRETVQQLR